MAVRRPLVRIGGVSKELPAGDTLPSNAFFTGSANLPVLTLGAGTVTLNVSPRAAGDVLVAGEVIVVTPASALPAGLNISYAIVTAQNVIQIGFTSALSITISSMSWTVCALR